MKTKEVKQTRQKGFFDDCDLSLKTRSTTKKKKEKTTSQVRSCPRKHLFGIDAGIHEHCFDCTLWDDCFKLTHE